MVCKMVKYDFTSYRYSDIQFWTYYTYALKTLSI